MQINNPVDIANQIAAAAAPLVVGVATPAVVAPLEVAPIEVLAINGVTPVAAPIVDTAAIVADAAASNLVVAGAEVPLAGAVTATATAGSIPSEPTVVVPVVVLTRAQQLQKTIDANIVKLDAAVKAIETATAQLGSIDKLDSIVPGTIVTVQLGRADTLRQVDGTVTGIKTEENGTKKFKVLVGEGFDATTEVVNEGQVLAVN